MIWYDLSLFLHNGNKKLMKDEPNELKLDEISKSIHERAPRELFSLFIRKVIYAESGCWTMKLTVYQI